MDIGSLLGLEQLTWGMLILIIVAAFSAGWIDAVVGGGGLLQLPALLLIPGIAPVQALATNKVGSIAGTAMSSATYLRRITPDLAESDARTMAHATFGLLNSTPHSADPRSPRATSR